MYRIPLINNVGYLKKVGSVKPHYRQIPPIQLHDTLEHLSQLGLKEVERETVRLFGCAQRVCDPSIQWEFEEKLTVNLYRIVESCKQTVSLNYSDVSIGLNCASWHVGRIFKTVGELASWIKYSAAEPKRMLYRYMEALTPKRSDELAQLPKELEKAMCRRHNRIHGEHMMPRYSEPESYTIYRVLAGGNANNDLRAVVVRAFDAVLLFNVREACIYVAPSKEVYLKIVKFDGKEASIELGRALKYVVAGTLAQKFKLH